MHGACGPGGARAAPGHGARSRMLRRRQMPSWGLPAGAVYLLLRAGARAAAGPIAAPADVPRPAASTPVVFALLSWVLVPQHTALLPETYGRGQGTLCRSADIDHREAPAETQHSVADRGRPFKPRRAAAVHRAMPGTVWSRPTRRGQCPLLFLVLLGPLRMARAGPLGVSPPPARLHQK